MWPLVIAAGASLLGGAMGSSATKKAANTQAAAAKYAADLQAEQAKLARKDIKEGQQASRDIYSQYLPKAEGAITDLPGQMTDIYNRGAQQVTGTAGVGRDVMKNIYAQGYGDIGRGLSTAYQQAGDIYSTAQPRLSEMARQTGSQAIGALQGAGTDLSGIPAEQRRAYDESIGRVQELARPYMDVGQQALQGYSEAAMSPYTSALFQQKLKGGQEALAEKLQAMGLGQSGAAVQATSDLYQDLAGQEQALAENRMLQLAQMGAGQTAGVQGLIGQLGGQYGSNIGQAGLTQAGMEQQQGRDVAGVIQTTGGREQDILGNYYRQMAGLGLEGAGKQANLQQMNLGAQAGQEQSYQDLLTSLQRGQMGQEAAVAGDVSSRLANLYTQAPAQLSQIELGSAPQLANIQSNLGTNLANIAQTGAANQGAAQLLRGQQNQQMIGDLAGAFSSYYGNQQTPYNPNFGAYQYPAPQPVGGTGQMGYPMDLQGI